VKVLDPGHLYELSNLDQHAPGNRVERLQFVKRIGDKFPGNLGEPRCGTISQEVIRALIDRTLFVNGQIEHGLNYRALGALRDALIALEMRSALARGDEDAAAQIRVMQAPETEATCDHCGHILCRRSHEP
jgi:hypothetical protein